MTYFQLFLDAVAITTLWGLIVLNKRFREQFLNLVQRLTWVILLAAGVGIVLAAFVGIDKAAVIIPAAVAILPAIVMALTMSLTQVYVMFFAMGRPHVRVLLPGDAAKDAVTLAQWQGSPVVREQVQEMVASLNHLSTFKDSNCPPANGTIFYGETGTGKTHLALAIGGSTNKPIVFVTASSLNGPFVAMGGMIVKALHKKLLKLAKKYGAVIILIDEFEEIARIREGLVGGKKTASGSMGGGLGMSSNGTLQTLLSVMDGAQTGDPWWLSLLKRWGLAPQKAGKQGHIMWLAATNADPEGLDPAIRRPGRLEGELYIGVPSREPRRALFRQYRQGLPVAQDVINNEDFLIDNSNGFTGATIKHILRAAGRTAIYRALRAREEATQGLLQLAADATREQLPVVTTRSGESGLRRLLVRLGLVQASTQAANAGDVLQPGDVQITLADVCAQIWIQRFGLPKPVDLHPVARERVAKHEGCHAIVSVLHPVDV